MTKYKMINMYKKNSLRKYIILVFAILFLVSCNSNKDSTFNIAKTSSISGDISINVKLANGINKKYNYDALDLDTYYDDIAAITINFDDMNSIKKYDSLIKENNDEYIFESGGIYKLKGNLIDKRIRISGNTGERVLLVLDNFNILSNKPSAIYAPDGCRVSLFLEEGTVNTIKTKNNGNLTFDKNIKQNDAIFVKDSLSISGKGSLNINGSYDTAIECNNILTIISGDISIINNGRGFNGKNGVMIKGGNFNINSNRECIKASNDNYGFIFIEDGSFNLVSNTDTAISCDNELILCKGNIIINAKKEGIQSKTFDMIDGSINIKTNDDGINTTDKNQAKKSKQENVYFRIAGGEINIDADMDGIDSNGDFYIDGGKIFISGTTSDNERIIDYNGDVRLISGEMIAVGPYEKMQDLGDKPNQNYIIVYYDDIIKEKTKISVLDDASNIILSFIPNKSYKSAIITSDKLITNNIYKIITGGIEKEITIKQGKNNLY